VGDGAGAGGVVGGASVGFGVGFGAVLTGLFVGAGGAGAPGAPAVVAVDVGLGAPAGVRLAFALADDVGLAPGVGCAAGVGDAPEDGAVVELDTVLAAVLAKTVAMPNALTALRSMARQVIRDSLRRPESRAAPRFRCFMRTADQDQG
jgi:hypothetical protein